MIDWIRKIFRKEKEKIQYELPKEDVKIKDKRVINTRSTTSSIREEDNSDWTRSTSKPNPGTGNVFEENKKAIKKEMAMLFSQTPVGQTYESIKHIKQVFGKSIPKPPSASPPPPRKGGPKKAAT